MNRNTSDNLNSISSGIQAFAIRLIVAVVFLMVLFRAVTFSYSFGHDLFYTEGVEEAPGHDVRVTIGEGMGARETAELLEKAGLIDNKIAFRAQAVFFGLDITPGSYVLNTSTGSREILETLDIGPQEEDGGGA